MQHWNLGWLMKSGYTGASPSLLGRRGTRRQWRVPRTLTSKHLLAPGLTLLWRTSLWTLMRWTPHLGFDAGRQLLHLVVRRQLCRLLLARSPVLTLGQR